MSEMKNFSAAQEAEAQKWFEENTPLVWEIIVFDEHGGEQGKTELLTAYFNLKMISIELRPHQFVLGVDYKSVADVMSGKELVSLSFWNPHPKGVADQFAKDFLIAKLTTL